MCMCASVTDRQTDRQREGERGERQTERGERQTETERSAKGGGGGLKYRSVIVLGFGGLSLLLIIANIALSLVLFGNEWQKCSTHALRWI